MSVFKAFGVKDVKISKLKSDTTEGLTFDKAVDCPAIQKLGLKPIIEEYSLEGDDGIVDTDAQLQGYEFSIENGKISLEALAILEGGTHLEADSDEEAETYTNKSTDKLNYFKIEAQIANTEEGDIHIVLPKCKATGGVEVSFANKEYAVVSFSGKAIPTTKDSECRQIIKNKIAKAIV